MQLRVRELLVGVTAAAGLLGACSESSPLADLEVGDCIEWTIGLTGDDVDTISCDDVDFGNPEHWRVEAVGPEEEIERRCGGGFLLVDAETGDAVCLGK